MIRFTNSHDATPPGDGKPCVATHRKVLLAATTLVLLSLIAPLPALAGGSGGNGGSTAGGTGGAGGAGGDGTNSNANGAVGGAAGGGGTGFGGGAPGVDGTNAGAGGGGGGGGGALATDTTVVGNGGSGGAGTIGAGGAGGNGNAFGASAGNGANGNGIGNDGGGGAGGADSARNGFLIGLQPGFNGGNGGNGDLGGSGGGGGGGGVGSPFNISLGLSATAAVAGGNGGNGGGTFVNSSAITIVNAFGGGGGGGGAGMAAMVGGLTLTNDGRITGGNGGAGGSGATSNGNPGAGGAGVIGGDLTIVNSGSISGGLSGDGTTRANAITFTGGSNTLTLNGGANLIGNIGLTGSLNLLQNTDFTLSNAVIGNGSVSKSGTGTLTLTGGSTYTGTTTINGGTLEVDGSVKSSTVTVNSGGTLSGTGTVGDPIINAGGTLSPGSVANPYGTLTLTDPLTFAAGAFYTVHISPSANSRTDVTGTATPGGATVNAIYASGSYVAKQYTILTASGGVSGTFSSLVNTNLPSGFTASLSYDPNDVHLDLALIYTAPNYGGGLNGNQQAVGNALTSFFNTTGGIPLVYGTLTPAGLTQASGELGTSSQQTTFQAMSQFMGLLTDPFMNRSSGNAAPGVTGYAEKRKPVDAFATSEKAPQALFAQRWNMWAAGFGGSQSTDGNATIGSNNTTSSIYGTAVGADYLVSPDTITGFAVAGGGTSFSVNGLGSGRSDLFQAGAYVRHTNGPTYISAALAYGWQDITTDRTVTIAGLDHLRAEFNANAYSGRVEGGYRLVAPLTGGIGLTPYAAAQFTTFDLPSYAEQVISGSGNFALDYGAKSPTDTRSELGLRSDKSFALADGVLTLRSRFAWAHDFNPDRAIAATFQALPGASFVVNGAMQAPDSALTTLSAEMRWMNGWSAAATFDGEFSNVTRSYAGKGVVRYAW